MKGFFFIGDMVGDRGFKKLKNYFNFVIKISYQKNIKQKFRNIFFELICNEQKNHDVVG